jgi:hypothetical protein
MNLPIRSLVTALSLVTSAASCGGKVVVDPLAETAKEACAKFCDALAACPAQSPQDCVAACVTETGYVGGCAPQAFAVLDCSASLPTDQLCAATGCEEERAQFMACTHPPGGCSTNQCDAAGGGVHCTTTCGGNVYETRSTGSLEQGWACTCIVNGATVGTCTDVTVASADCCLGIFAET